MCATAAATYGLWGLYTVAARVSGFVPEHPQHGVTDRARAFIEQCYTPHLERGERELLRLMKNGGSLDLKRKGPQVQGLARILGPEFTPEERTFYGELLRDGVQAPGSHGRQQVSRELLEGHLIDEPLGRAEVVALMKAATLRGEHALATRLRKVAALEALLAPSAALFDALLAAGQRTPAEVATEIADRWGRTVPHLDRGEFAEILPEIQDTVGDEIAGAMDSCHVALTDARYAEALEALVLWNRLVMGARKSGPWVVLGARGVSVPREMASVLFDSIREALAGRPVRHAVFTTFCLDPRDAGEQPGALERADVGGAPAGAELGRG